MKEQPVFRLAGYGLLLLALTGCTYPRSTEKSSWVTVADVISNPRAYDGKIVTIKGWASIRPEDYGIWASQADYEKRDWRKCVSLLNFYSDNSLNRALDRGPVLVFGTFFQAVFHDENGHVVVRLGTCSPLGIRFQEPDGLRKFPE